MIHPYRIKLAQDAAAFPADSYNGPETIAAKIIPDTCFRMNPIFQIFFFLA
jgi:hypothetical protein